MLLPVIFFDCLPTCILSVVQFLVLESIYGTSLRYLPSCSQINQHKHFNYSAGNTATPAYSGATRPLDVVWNRTTQILLEQNIPSGYCLPLAYTSTHIRVGFRIIQVTNNYISISLVCENADIVNRTRTTFLLDSLASYWNTIIPYRQMPPVTAIKKQEQKQ